MGSIRMAVRKVIPGLLPVLLSAALCSGDDFAPDREAPTAEIYMGGTVSPDGGYYYRADNCGIRIVFRDGGRDLAGGTFRSEIDGNALLERDAVSLGAEDCYVILYSAAEISEVLPDGEHTIRILALDGAGNLMTEEPGGCGATLFTGGGSFILDTSPPVMRLELMKEDGSPVCGRETPERTYLREGFRAEIVYADENPAWESIDIRRLSTSNSGTDWSKETDLPEEWPLYPEQGAYLSTCGDAVWEDGVYRYEVLACDRAGNPAVFEGELLPDGRSPYYVVDSLAGGGTVELLSDGAQGAVSRADGADLTGIRVVSGEEISVVVRSDPFEERLPVTIRASVRYGDGKTVMFQSEEACYGGCVVCGIQGEGEFQVTEIVITDLAGNVYRADDPVTYVVDRTDPVVTAFELSGISAGGNYYRSDVKVRLMAGDPLSGIGDVTGRVSVSGRGVVRELVLKRSADLIGDTGGQELTEVFEGIVECGSGLEADEIIVTVEITDNAGNRVERQTAFGIDSIPPHVVIRSADEAVSEIFYNKAVHYELVVTDRHFSERGISLQVNGKEYPLSEWRAEADGAWKHSLLFEEDGTYELSVRAEDLYGNSTDEVSFEENALKDFVIDRTAPAAKVSIGGAAALPELYASTGPEVIVTVEDEHFQGEHGLSVSGAEGEGFRKEENVLSCTLSDEGVYIIEGTVTDEAGNRSEHIGPYRVVVDLTPPMINVTGVQDGESCREIPEVVFEILDVNADPGSVSIRRITGSGESVEAEWDKVEEEGALRARIRGLKADEAYEFTAEAADLAGNRTTKTLRFTVNQSGPQFENVHPEETGIWLREAVTPEFVIRDPDPLTGIFVTVNGREASYELSGSSLKLTEELSDDGKYVVGITVRDGGGYENIMDQAEYYIDRTAPRLSCSVSGGNKRIYTEDVEIVVSADDPDAEFEFLEVDGEANEWEKRGIAAVIRISAKERGQHVIRACARDPAGNISEVLEYRIMIAGNYYVVAAAAVLVFAAVGLLFFYRRERRKCGYST